MSTYTQMKTFVTVIELNSFNQASKKLFISPAEISRRITALEGSLNVILIHRTTRRLTLTPIGEIYFEDCQRILKDLEMTHLKIRSQQEEPSGELSIFYGNSNDLIPYIKAFNKRYPKIRLNLKKMEMIPDFKKQEADILLGLSLNSGLDENCVRKKMGMTRHVLCASPEYLMQNKGIIKPQDLSAHAYIAHSNRPNMNTLTFNNGQTIHMNTVLLMNSTEEMVKAACEDLGLISVHIERVEHHLETGELVEVLNDYATDSVNVYMVYYYERYLEPKIKAFVDFFDV